MLFNTNEKKQARLATVIEPTRLIHGGNLPEDMFYVTLAGHCALYGEVVPGSDYDHMINSGLLQPEQFIGVDDNVVVQHHNSQLSRSIWITCPIQTAISKLVETHKIGLVFLDTTVCPIPSSGLPLFDAVISALADVNYTTVIVVNWCLKFRQHNMKPPAVIEEVIKRKSWQNVQKSNPNWAVGQIQYEYMSNVGKNTRMGTWVFTNAPSQMSLF